MKKLILILTLFISTSFGQSNPIIDGRFANINGNLFTVNRLSVLSSDNLAMSVLSGRFTLAQTGTEVQAILDGTFAVDAFSIDNGIDDKQPTFSIVGDADSDAGGDVSETIQLTLVPNATPTSAAWNFTTSFLITYLCSPSSSRGYKARGKPSL